MSKYTKLFSDTLIFGVGNFTTKLIYFFLMPIYTLTLTTADFGLADLLNNSLQLIIPIFTLCISDAVFRFSLDKDTNFEALLHSGLKTIVWGVAIVSIASCVIYYFDSHTYWCVFSLLFLSEALKSLFAQFTRGLGKVKEYAINGIIAAIVLLLLTYVFLKVLNWGIDGYLWAFVFANVASILYLLFVVGIRHYIKRNSADRLLLKSMLIYSLPLIPNMLSWWLTNISSRYIVAGICGLSASGLFAAASKLPALINVIASVFQLSWQFASVKEYQESSKSQFFSTVFRFYSFIIIFAGSIIICLIPYISYIILKGDFYEAWVYTPLLLYSAIIGCYSIFFGTFYSVVKDNKKAMYTTLVGAIVNVVLCVALIPLIGIYGALIANVLSYAIIVILRVRDCNDYVEFHIQWRVLFVGLALLLCQSIVLMTTWEYSFAIASLVPIAILIIHHKDFRELGSFFRNLAHQRQK